MGKGIPRVAVNGDRHAMILADMAPVSGVFELYEEGFDSHDIQSIFMLALVTHIPTSMRDKAG